jgi:hypothetical protein
LFVHGFKPTPPPPHFLYTANTNLLTSFTLQMVAANRKNCKNVFKNTPEEKGLLKSQERDD